MSKVLATIATILFPIALWAAEQTVVVDVNGNCNMCRKKIEKAAKSVSGVDDASWDKKAKKLTIEFDDAVTNKDKVVAAVLKAGYDADGKMATDEAYNTLPDCCRYRD